MQQIALFYWFRFANYCSFFPKTLKRLAYYSLLSQRLWSRFWSDWHIIALFPKGFEAICILQPFFPKTLKEMLKRLANYCPPPSKDFEVDFEAICILLHFSQRHWSRFWNDLHITALFSKNFEAISILLLFFPKTLKQILKRLAYYCSFFPNVWSRFWSELHIIALFSQRLSKRFWSNFHFITLFSKDFTADFFVWEIAVFF